MILITGACQPQPEQSACGLEGFVCCLALLRGPSLVQHGGEQHAGEKNGGGGGPFCVGKRETGKCWGCVRLVFYSHVFLMLLVGLELEKKMSQEPTPPHNFEHQSVWFTRMDYHQLSTCMTLSEQSCNSGCISHHGRADRLEIFGWTGVPVNGGDQFPTEEFFKSHDILSRWERQ